uniref:HECT domain-containing protein n=1 Tax=viral metagenome TaxID=1070528 RepID=A0A6C0LS65_9ZZZZ
MPAIKNINLNNESILITDDENKLWIMGSNDNKRLGYGDEGKGIYAPICINSITLSESEYVKQFYVGDYQTFILTNEGNLYLSYLNSKKGKGSKNLSDSQSSHENNDSESINHDNSESDSDNDINNSSLMHRVLDPIFVRLSNLTNIDIGFIKLTDHVTDMITSKTSILFIRDNKLCYYMPDRIKQSYSLELTTEIVFNFYNYRIINFPFEINKIQRGKNFYYINCGKYHNIIALSDENDSLNETYYPLWIYFQTNLKINVDNIHYIGNVSPPNLFVGHENMIYHYNFFKNNLELSNLFSSKIISISSNDSSEILWVFILNSDGLFDVTYSSLMTMICSNSEYLDNLIDLNLNDDENCLIVNGNYDWKYKFIEGNMLINVHNFQYYKLLDNGLLFYEIDKLCYISFSEEQFSEESYGTIEIDKITHDNRNYFIYTFANLPNPITNISFTNSLIIVQSDDNYFYHTFNVNKNFSVNTFTNILLKNHNATNIVIDKHLIQYKSTLYNNVKNQIIFNMRDNDKQFEQALSLMFTSFEESDSSIGIRYIHKGEIISYGEGPKRKFYSDVISEFYEKCLIRKNMLTTFNSEKMKTFDCDELISIGKILHIIICYGKNGLQFELPLSLLISIKNKPIKIEELEYFASLEDPMLVENVIKYKNDPEKFVDFGSDYEDYESLLKNICGISESDQNFCQYIKQGFNEISDIANLHLMNYPTLNYYISGNVIIDRNMLIKNLVIHYSIYEKLQIYREDIVKIIKNLSEEKLKILLKNWSGTSILLNEHYYKIEISDRINNDIIFTTCTISILISHNIMNHLDIYPLEEILTSTIVNMIDV